MKFIKSTLLLAITTCIAACSNLQNEGVIQNRNSDYLKARSIAPLNIPPGMSSSTIHAEYPVSTRSYPQQTQEVNLIPPGLNTAGK